MSLYIGNKKVCPVIKVGESPAVLETKTYTVDSTTPTTITITPGTGYDGMSQVTVDASYIENQLSTINGTGTVPVPSGTISITTNGTHDVTNYASADVNVSGGGGVSTLYAWSSVDGKPYYYIYTKTDTPSVGDTAIYITGKRVYASTVTSVGGTLITVSYYPYESFERYSDYDISM